MTDIKEKRTMTSKTYYLGGGEYEMKMTPYPLHYQDEDGNWEDIDLTIKPIGSWEFSHAVTSNVYRAYFHDVSVDNTHLVSVEYAKELAGEPLWVNFKLKGATPTESSCDGTKFTFKNCFPNVDVTYDVSEERLKEDIILSKPTNIREFVFTLKHSGVSIKKEGSFLTIDDSSTGFPVWNLDSPFMVDSEGNVSYGVVYDLGYDGEFDTLTVSLTDEDFLSSAIYPVAVDPTASLAGTGGFLWKTRHISSGDNGRGNWYVGANNPGYSDYAENYTLVTFPDLFKLVQTEPVMVNKATLKMRCKSDNAGYAGGNWYGMEVLAKRTTNNWWTGNIAPTEAETIATPVPFRYPLVGYVGKWVEVDLTSTFRDKTSTGISLRRGRVGQGAEYVSFGQPGAGAADEPTLVVTYLRKPVLGFHDGTGDSGAYYSDGYDDIFKLLDFGTMVAGQVSMPQKVFLRNLAGFDITNLKVYVQNFEFPVKTRVEVSKYNNPFIPEDTLAFGGTYADEEDVSFYVRVATQEDTMAGGDFNIYAKADPL